MSRGGGVWLANHSTLHPRMADNPLPVMTLQHIHALQQCISAAMQVVTN